jgi:SM-20-related protein
MLHLSQISNTEIQDSPWRWGLAEDIWASDDQGILLTSEFPRSGFTWFCTTEGPKQLRYWGRFLVQPGENFVRETENLHPAWIDFAAEIISGEYRAAVGDTIGVDLTDAIMEATFWRYEPGCWFSGHTGKSERIVNQVFYFNTEWPEDWGGSLRILRSPDMNDTAVQIAPTLGRSAFIVRSDNSWHAISPVTIAAPRSRQTVVVSFLSA